MRVVRNAITRVRNLIVHELPVIGAVALAAENTATDRSVRGYAVAVGIALLRLAVSPAFTAKAIEEKAISPKLVAAVEALLAQRQAEAKAATDAAIAAANAPVVG